MSSSEWRALLEEGWTGEFQRIAGGPFLSDRFLVRAEDASMEPIIPTGSLCEFRAQSDEDPEGKIVLALISRYAKRTPNVVMKKFEKFLFGATGAVAETTKIILSSENRAYPSLELREGVDKVEILGVFDHIIVN
jgi:SOS-response transcriptional repressor LexA